MPFLSPELRPAPQAETLSVDVRLALAVGALEAVRSWIAEPYLVDVKKRRLSQRDLLTVVDQIAKQALRRVK